VEPDATPPPIAEDTTGAIANGEQVTPQDVAQLKEALADPGGEAVPEVKLTEGPVTVMEVPEATLKPDEEDAGQPLEQDPAIMTVQLGRPTPSTWVQFHPGKSMICDLLAYQASRNSSPEYHFVADARLAKRFGKRMRQVTAYLCNDAEHPDDVFLWLVTRSEMSPYHNAIASVLGRGEAFIRKHSVLFFDVDMQKKKCSIDHRPLDPDLEPVLPTRPIGRLLYEALGADRVIKDSNHPIAKKLLGGRRLP
jgi:hypothetical protein